MKKQPLRRLFGFIAIGGLGFLVEAAIITWAGASPWAVPALMARVVSFPCAVLLTWWLNRTYNFRSTANPLAEGGRYMVTQVAGAVANLGVFALGVRLFPLLDQWPVVALGVGACAGLAVNFALSYAFVFNKRKLPDGTSP
jgi:putative flippase GtrA